MKFTISSGAAAKPATENNQEQMLPEPTAEEFLQACMDLNEASADLQGILGEVKELDAVHTALRHAHNTLVDFDSSAEAIKVLDLDGQLSKLAQVEAEMQGLQEAAAEAVEAVAQKIDAALEEQKEGLMAKFKAWCKQAWAAIKRFFGTIWTWLRGLFGHGTLLSWKEAQCVYDMEQGFAAVAKAINEAFMNPNFEEAMNNMAAKMAEAFSDPKVQEKAATMDFSSKSDESNETLTINGGDSKQGVEMSKGFVSYKSAVDALNKCGLGKGVYAQMKDAAEDVKQLNASIEKLTTEKYESFGEDTLKAMQDAMEDTAKGAAEVMTVLDMVKTTYKVNPDTFQVEFNSEVSDFKGPPGSSGWNLKTVREYMQNFDKFCNNEGFNAKGVLDAIDKTYDGIFDKLDKAEVASAAAGKVRAFARANMQVNADLSKFYGLMVRIVYFQARACSRVLSRIKAEMRKNQKKAA